MTDYTLTDDRKMLTEYMGECWHEPGRIGRFTRICRKCGKKGVSNRHRTFTIWRDLGDLKEVIVEKGEWKEFLHSAFNSSLDDEPMSMFSDEDMDGESRFYDEDFISWLLHAQRFPWLVKEWLKGII